MLTLLVVPVLGFVLATNLRFWWVPLMITAGAGAAADNKKSKDAASGDPGRPRRRQLQTLTDTFNTGTERNQQATLALAQAAFQWAQSRKSG